MYKKIIFLFLFGTFLAFGQQKQFSGDPDEAFRRARELAFNKERKKAQDTLLLILTKYPNYHDIRAFLASTYSWDGNYDEARKEFEYVLEKDSNRLETWKGAINNELWSENASKALQKTAMALKYFPDDPDLLYQKASAEDNMGNKEKALSTVEYLLHKNPEHEKAISYRESLIQQLRLNYFGVGYAIDVYSRTFDPMQYFLAKYSRQTKYGSIHGTFNLSRRFASTGAQFEIDAYPRIINGLYAYVNFGVSNSFLYPDIRYGAELYKSLPLSLEASIGFRALKYSETTVIYTGSVGWYTGNSYISFRTYITPGEPDASKSGTLSYRKYRKDANNYFSFSASIGFSPEIDRFAFGGNENEIINLKSQSINFGYFFSSKHNKNNWGIRAGVAHQEISFDPGSYFWIYSIATTWGLNFK